MTREFIESKMRGNLKLSEDFPTEEAIFDYFFDNDHNIYYLEDDIGFLGIQEVDEYAYVAFAWYDGSFKAHRQMVELGHKLYKTYTLEMELPILYSGKSNFYRHHSVEISPDLWQLVL